VQLARPGDPGYVALMPPAERDQQLIHAARNGDREATVALLERYRDSVYRFGMRMCQNAADAEDVLQETLLTAAQKLQGYRGEASFSSWLYAIARSGCFRRYRATRQQAELDVNAIVDPAPRPDEMVFKLRLRAILERALASLASSYREVLLLRDVEGLTAPEVAAALDLSVPAVKSRLHRARAMLRDRIERLVRLQSGTLPPPDCPDAVAWLAATLQQELTPQQCAKLETHLAKCLDPAGQYDPLRRLLAVCAASGDAAPPEQLKKSIRVAIQTLTKAES
jgi:RNA polymerase sigma-70 factor (ECF subfamily)